MGYAAGVPQWPSLEEQAIAATSINAREKRAIALLAALAVLFLASCESPARGPTVAGDGSQAHQLNAFVAAADLTVGINRFPFVLIESDGQATVAASVRATFAKLSDDGAATVKSSGDAIFRSVTSEFPHEHEDGSLHVHEHVDGVYVVSDVIFDQAGFWQAEFEITRDGVAETLTRSVAFQVLADSATFAVGDKVPASRNPTVLDVSDLSEITTHQSPVRGMYELTIAQALEQPKPVIVAFSTPAFCVSRACGPVTDVVAGLYEKYSERINFIHVEPWVLATARNEGRLMLTDVAREWRLPSEPWVFVIDSEGRVSARFEGLVSEYELAEALKAVNR